MEDIRYLNVDCIISSTEDLSELVSFINTEIFILWNEQRNSLYSLGFETNLIESKSPTKDISKFIDLFESLPPTLTTLLENCSERTFDIGFECGDSGLTVDTYLDADLVKSVAELDFSINIRIYPLSKN